MIGIVPAAGAALRLRPLKGSKELVPVGGRPVLEYLVERMRAAGAREIVVVTRPDKHDVSAHAIALGLRVVHGMPKTVSESLALGLRRADDAEVVLLGFPDTVWEPVDGFTQLLEELAPGVDTVLGVFESAQPQRSDVVTLDGDRVLSVDVKPSEPSSSLIWGCAAARKTALAGLELHDEPGTLFDELAGQGRVRAVPFPGQMIDVGTPEALARARRLLGP